MTETLVASEPVHSYKYFDVRSLFAAACMFFFVFGTGFMVGTLAQDNPVFGVCEQQRHRPAYASGQTDQSLYY